LHALSSYYVTTDSASGTIAAKSTPHPILLLEMTRGLVAVLLGIAIGYLAVRLGDVGQLVIVGLLLGLVAYYAYTAGRRSPGLTLLASGGTVSAILGNIVLETLVDPAVHMQPSDVTRFWIAVVVAVGGLVVAVRSADEGRRAPAQHREAGSPR